MADGDTTKKNPQRSEGEADAPRDKGVPGAHGKEDQPPKGQSGATHVRQDPDEIHPSEDVDDDKD